MVRDNDAMERGNPSKKAGRAAAVLCAALALAALPTSCQKSPKARTYTVGMVIESPVAITTLDAFKAGMSELGYAEGKNITYAFKGSFGSDTAAISEELKSLVSRKVDLLLVVGLVPATLARQAVAGAGIPVIFAPAHDVVANGLAESMSRPGGDLTGMQAGGEIAQSMELLAKISVHGNKMYVPYNPADTISVEMLPLIGQLASRLGIELVPGKVKSVKEAVAAIEGLPQDMGGILRILSPTFDPQNSELSRAAIRRGLPMGGFVHLDDDMLFSLAVDPKGMGNQAARMADQILRGVKPADLPIETAEFDFTISLKTARAIGLSIPDDILSRADRVIR